MLTIVVCALLLAQAASPAQPKPDFAGRWTLVEPADPGPKVPVQMAVTMVGETTKDGPTVVVTVKRTVGPGVQTQTYKIGLVGGLVRPGGMATRIAALWDGNTLVLQDGSYPLNPARGRSSEHEERWSLDADGRLVIDVTDTQPEKDPQKAKWVYARGVSRS